MTRTILFCLISLALPLFNTIASDQAKVVSAEIISVPAQQGDYDIPVGNVQITDSAGKKQMLTKDGHCLIIAHTKNGIVVWTSYKDTKGEKEKVNGIFHLRSADGTIKDIERGPFIEELGFDKKEKFLIVKTRGRHGPAHFAKYDVQTGKLLETIDEYIEYAKQPKWAQPYSDDKPGE